VGFLNRILGPSNSLVLLFDHLSVADSDEMEFQLDEIAKYYRFATLSQIANAARSRRQTGLAGVAFANARKSVFMRAVPFLQQRDIPFTLFLRPDSIGLNHLPIEDEFAAYARKYENPLGLSVDIVSDRVWQNPPAEEELRDRLRREVGPLPVDQFDPTQFFVTWGKIVEIEPSRIELGIVVHAEPNVARLTEAMTFIRRQTGRAPQIALSPRALTDTRVLREVGLTAALIDRQGYVEKTTSVFDIPHVKLEKSPIPPR